MLNLSAFCEQMLIHEHACVAIDKDMPLDRAAVIGCAVTTGAGTIFNACAVVPGETVAVVGCGGVGLAAINAAKIAGAGKVIAVDPVPEKRKLAEVLGATHSVDAMAEDAVEQIVRISGGGVHHAIEAVGRQASADLAVKILRRGGTATILGMMPLDCKVGLGAMDLLSGKKLQGAIMGMNHFPVDLPRLVDFYMRGLLDLDTIIAERIGLDQVNEGFDKMRAGTFGTQRDRVRLMTEDIPIDFDKEMVGTIAVPERDQLDLDRLTGWFEGNVDGFAGPISYSKFKGGQSNPTYRIDTPGRSYVLRRQPFGKLLPSAHAVDREYTAMHALGPTGFPGAEDLRTMRRSRGHRRQVLRHGPGRRTLAVERRAARHGPEADRREIYNAMIDTMADLHTKDPVAIGLGDYGKPTDYCARQIARWTKQYKLSETEHMPQMERLIEWLPQTIPPQHESSVVHGDYRLDNMIFDKDANRVLAVLDWELSTLGDPIADFSYLMLNWHNPADGRAGLLGLDLEAARHSHAGGGGRTLCRAHRLSGAADGLVFRLQPVPARRHHAGHQEARDRWNRVIGPRQADERAGRPADRARA